MTTRWSEADLQRLLAARAAEKGGSAPVRDATRAPPLSMPPSTDRYRSTTERRFALEVLALWQHDGIIQEWHYAPMKGLWLAERTSYTPDFLTIDPGERITFYEVKGAFVRPQDWLKFKLAAERYWFIPFVLAQYAKGAWTYKNAQSRPVPSHARRDNG